MPRETRLQTQILAALKGRGGKWYEKSASMYEHSGQPDIHGGYRGFLVVFEVKRPKQSYGASRIQMLIINEYLESGATLFARVIDSVAEALNVLDEIDALFTKAT